MGIPADQAEAGSRGAGLKGAPAGEYVETHAHDVEMNETQELRAAVATVQSAVTVPLTQHRRDALVASSSTSRDPHFRASSTLRLLNQGDYSGACEAKVATPAAPGQTVQHTLGTFVGHVALKADSDQMVKIRRDVNHDRHIDARDPVSRVARASGMHIHLGGVHNTWSEGCQTLPPAEHARFFATLRWLAPQQRHFSYVLVDAPG